VRSERAINRVFWGSYRFDVVLEGPAGVFRSRVGTRLMERVAGLARAAPEVGGVETYVTPLDEIARAIGEQAGAVGFSAAELADLFTLAEMSGSRSEFARLVSPDAAVARARLYMKSADYARAQSLEAYLDERLPALLAAGASQLGLRVHYSGDVPAASALVESIVGNQLRSIAWTLAIVAALLLVAGRNARALLALVPVMAATGGLFAAMGWLDVPLGIATSMFASLAVGVGVDFGIHFLHRFDAERQTGLPCAGALLATMQKTGRALLWNALVLAAGFSVLVGSALEPNHRLGLLLAGSTLACYVATLLFLPALLGLFDSRLPSGQAARKAI
jgi:predicted RND superfamily exporter protein